MRLSALKLYPYLEYPIASVPFSIWCSYLVGIQSARTLRHAHPWRPDHTFKITKPHTCIYLTDNIWQCSAPALQFNRLKWCEFYTIPIKNSYEGHAIHTHVKKFQVQGGWRERNQKDATNLMFIIKVLSQHVSAIIMPIIRRTRPCTATQRHCGSRNLRVFSPLVTVQNTICGGTRSCSPDDEHNDGRNMLR